MDTSRRGAMEGQPGQVARVSGASTESNCAKIQLYYSHSATCLCVTSTWPSQLQKSIPKSRIVDIIDSIADSFGPLGNAPVCTVHLATHPCL